MAIASWIGMMRFSGSQEKQLSPVTMRSKTAGQRDAKCSPFTRDSSKAAAKFYVADSVQAASSRSSKSLK
jgi:hypothetical protein